jgi:hypothetical protein
MTSEKHFERVKTVFNVKNKEELSKKLKEYGQKTKERISYGSRSYTHIPFINELVNPDTIAIYR